MRSATDDRIRVPPRRDKAVVGIIRAWRQLTTPRSSPRAGPGQRTVVACSGGADSSALLLALAAASRDLVVAHVVHDLRPRAEALADRDAVRELADALDLSFVEAEAPVASGRGSGQATSNLEGRARRARYAALAGLAREQNARFVAVAHHADDQLETVLMALLRGSSPRGLSGAATKRRLAGRGVWLIRPMLDAGTERSDTEGICARCGWTWREDLTNQDTSRFRAAVRRQIVPLLKTLRPGAAQRVSNGARLMRDAARLVDAATDRLWAEQIGEPEGPAADGSLAWPRDLMRRQPEILIGNLLRRAASQVSVKVGADRLGSRVVRPIVRATRDSCTDPREFAAARAAVRVDAHAVTVRPRQDA